MRLPPLSAPDVHIPSGMDAGRHAPIVPSPVQLIGSVRRRQPGPSPPQPQTARSDRAVCMPAVDTCKLPEVATIGEATEALMR